MHMNKERIENGEDPYMNPRNTASGSLKLQDSSAVAERPLECLLYSIASNGANISTQYEVLKKAKSWGFKVPDAAKLCRSTDEVMEYVEYWDVHIARSASPPDGGDPRRHRGTVSRVRCSLW